MQPTLIEWQKQVLPCLLKERIRPPSGRYSLTILAYFFWDDDRINTEFDRLKCAYLCAFRVLGQTPAVLVVNRTTVDIEGFCQAYGIEIQVEKSLSGGGLPAMSIDCVSRLCNRFDTEYVLVIQNDGFPLNGSLTSFVGTYDYVGAPWPGHTCYRDLFPYPQYGVGNGGFSLRSKRICVRASEVYKRYLSRVPYNWLFTEDVFYCKTMRFFSSSWRHDFKFPPIDIAAQFSVECLTPFLPDGEHPPIGFHSAYGFQQYVAHYGVPFKELLDC